MAVPLVVACSEGKVADTTSTAEEETTSGELEIEEDVPSSDAPVLVEATVQGGGNHCYLNAVYEDRQGPADVRRGTVSAVDKVDGTVYWTDDLFGCVDYTCIGSFDTSHPEYSAAPCSRIDEYDLRAFVYDKSGNESNELVLEHI